jgi:uncharacterized protein
MTPEERKLVTELFDRVASLENNPRDPAAVDAINEGLDRAPNAVYSLVQTVLVQDEALKRADARIKELEGGSDPAPQDTSFLGNARDQVLGRRDETRAGSVPSVRPASGGISSAWRNTGVPPQPTQYAQPPQGAQAPGPAQGGGGMGGGGMGGSFLGTAAAAAAGVVGSSLLMGGIRSMMGQSHGRSAFDSGSASRDGGGGGGGGGELARQAGIDDMGKGARSQEGSKSSLFDGGQGEGEQDAQNVSDDADLDSDDLGGDDFDDGGSDDE